ncbi:MAG: hypothetical protein U5L72_20070 [Bacteroidales bacterium]|nr:hypothetical protein [Bacteroidales bacterium]
MISLLGSQTGRYLYTTTHRLLIDRGRIIITPRGEEEQADYLFSSIDEMRMSGLFTELHITDLRMDRTGDPLPVSPCTASLDLSPGLLPC